MSRKPRRGRDPLTLARVRLEARRSLRPLLLWLALGGAALYSAAFLLSHLHITLPGQHRYTFGVAVADAHGVVGGDEVRIAGVPVGTITGVSLHGTQPVLSVQMGEQYAPVYRNAVAQLRPNTPLDDMYLDIVSRGSPGAGRLGSHSVLSADRTQTSVDIGEVLDVFDSDVRPHMATAITQLGEGLGDHGAQLRQALVELAPFLRVVQRLSGEVATRQGETRELVHNLGLMSAELAHRDRQVTALIHAAGTTFTTLGDNAGSLAQLLTALPPTLRRLPPALSTVRRAANAVDPALSALGPVAHALPAGLKALGSFAAAARPAALALRPPLPGVTRLLASTIPVGSNLAQSFATLTPQAPALDHVTGAIVPCETAMSSYFQYFNSIYKYSDDLSAFLRSSNDTGLASAVGEPNPFLSAGPTCTTAKSG